MVKILKELIKEEIENPCELELTEILEIFEVKTFKKGTFIKKPFTISKEIGFLIEGNIRSVVFKENGDEITFKILEKHSFIADVVSIKTEQPTPIGFECLNDVSVLIAPIKKFLQLLKTNLTLNILMREHIIKITIEMGKKNLAFLKGTAKDRYQFILENNPSLLKKFPLRLIASIIGITPTQLSRIRNKK
jgi:CRP-like cAMP-binding protein